MRFACYAIIGKTKMYTSESCCSADEHSLSEELESAREEEPGEDYKIVPLFTRRHTKKEATA